MKEKLVVVAILLIIAGFGMMHSVASTMEVVSLLMIGIGAGYLLFLLLKKKGKK
ncbi:hypothetical protein [Carboxylicivirga sp. N1Y90]|uniref:hypothetical protein n=1 Tax=Carboxylicivirga fragile TaxID=3417571 RepID=UPI003D3329A7|nr:hypothetical protein [Marinilabiliaceae bacterium N1Y90]